MKFYQLWPTNGFEWINATNPNDYEAFHQLRGESLAAEWRPIEVCRVKAEKSKPARESDFPWLGGHALILRETAIQTLGALLTRDGELLPLACDDGTSLHVLNSRIVNALDYERSSITFVPGTEKIMRIAEVVLIEERVRSVDIFRLPHRASPSFVSDAFRSAVISGGLRGLDFEECLV